LKYSASHTVYTNELNIEVPSVTTILKILNKPALLGWANYLGFRHRNIKDELLLSSTIGTLVHQLTYSYLMNKYFIFIDTHMCSKNTIKRYMNNFLNWKLTHSIQPIYAEKKIVLELFGGTIDLYCNLDNKLTIIDYKTSKIFYSSMFLQLAAYCILLEEKGYVVEQAGIILIHENDYKEKIINRDELAIYIEIFKLLVIIFHNWFDLNKDKWNVNIVE